MKFIFQINNVFVYYSYNNDIVSITCQTSSENSKIFMFIGNRLPRFILRIADAISHYCVEWIYLGIRYHHHIPLHCINDPFCNMQDKSITVGYSHSSGDYFVRFVVIPTSLPLVGILARQNNGNPIPLTIFRQNYGTSLSLTSPFSNSPAIPTITIIETSKKKRFPLTWQDHLL